MEFCHTEIENLSDPIGYLLDFTHPYYTALVGNMKARAKKDKNKMMIQKDLILRVHTDCMYQMCV
jgi:hypothetical protein